MAVIAPNGPYKIRTALPSASLVRLPMSPGPRDRPSLRSGAASSLQRSLSESAAPVSEPQPLGLTTSAHPSS